MKTRRTIMFASVLACSLGLMMGGGREAAAAAGLENPPASPIVVDFLPLEEAGPITEPAAMGLLGIGLTGLITLRRIRKYFS